MVTYFLKLLFWSSHVTAVWPLWALALALPSGGLVIGLLIHYGAPDTAGHGTEAVIRAVHQKAGQINWKVAPIKALATMTTIGAGGSVGKEGLSALFGSHLGRDFLIAAVPAFIMIGNHSVYPSQRVRLQKHLRGGAHSSRYCTRGRAGAAAAPSVDTQTSGRKPRIGTPSPRSQESRKLSRG